MSGSRHHFVDKDDRSDKILRKEVLVPAKLEDVWSVWTTDEGLMTFFAPEASTELRVGGPYEIYFYPKAAQGSKGSEDCQVLSYVPLEMLSFSWNAPLEFGELRSKHTIVVLRFEEVEPGAVKVIFWQHGWGRGEDWDKLYDYFDKAWSHVLGNLKKRFVAGPINWRSG